MSPRPPSVRIPKYWSIVDHLENLMKESIFGPDEPLPTEASLEELFGVSRGTVRRAFDELAAAGRINRRPGLGTFVAQRRMPRALPELTGFSEHLRSLGISPGSVPLSQRRLPVGNALETDFPARSRLKEFVRLRLADGDPVGLHRLVVTEDVAALARIGQETATDGSLYDRLEAAGVVVDFAEEHLTARKATRSEARHLRVRPGEVVLEVRRKTFDASGSTVEVVVAVYRGDRYDYVVWLERRDPASARSAMNEQHTPQGPIRKERRH